MTMQSLQNGNGGNDDDVVNDKLHKQFKNLEQVWDSFKRTESQSRRGATSHRRRRKHRSPMDNDVKVLDDGVLGLSDYYSPSSLQQNPKQYGSSEEEEWNVRTNDLAVLEMLSERKDSMRSGKFKGRSLYDALESASKMGKEEKQDGSHFQSGSSSSSDVVQGSGVKRRLFSSHSSLDCICDDDDDVVHGVREDDYCHCSPSSNSLCSSLSSVERNGKVEPRVEAKRDQVVAVGGGKWMGWVAILLMAFALGIITWRSFDGYRPSLEYDDFYYPT